jgi:hypothetical protein
MIDKQALWVSHDKPVRLHYLFPDLCRKTNDMTVYSGAELNHQE